MTAKNAATLFGVVFLIIGVLGYVPNPIVGPTGDLRDQLVHNVIHLVSGIALLAAPMRASDRLDAEDPWRRYGMVAICGFFMVMDGMMMGVAINEADKWLHVGLAIAILSGLLLPDTSASPATA